MHNASARWAVPSNVWHFTQIFMWRHANLQTIQTGLILLGLCRPLDETLGGLNQIVGLVGQVKMISEGAWQSLNLETSLVKHDRILLHLITDVGAFGKDSEAFEDRFWCI